jgi:hypothetical protein
MEWRGEAEGRGIDAVAEIMTYQRGEYRRGFKTVKRCVPRNERTIFALFRRCRVVSGTE